MDADTTVASLEAVPVPSGEAPTGATEAGTGDALAVPVESDVAGAGVFDFRS